MLLLLSHHTIGRFVNNQMDTAVTDIYDHHLPQFAFLILPLLLAVLLHRRLLGHPLLRRPLFLPEVPLRRSLGHNQNTCRSKIADLSRF